MEQHDEINNRIKTKILFLLNQVKMLIKSNIQMQLEIEELKKTVEYQKNTIEEINYNNKIIKLASEMQLSAEEKKQLKLAITEKINQIDECIRMLSE